MMMLLCIGTHSVTTTLNVHSRSRSFVSAIDLRGLAPSILSEDQQRSFGDYLELAMQFQYNKRYV